MKTAFYFSAILFLLYSCGDPAADKAGKSDSAKKDSLLPDSVPREVMKGKGGDWPFKPDSCFNDLVLGNAQSFALFWRKNGANMKTLEGNRKIMSYFTTKKTEWMAVYITKDQNGKERAYGMVLQKAGTPGSPAMPCADKPEVLYKPNVITGHGIYIGMSPYYVQSVYTDQKMTQWEKGDTLYLVYHPQEKDAKYFPYYNWKNYTATYKFVEDRLRRVEYFCDPADLEKR